MSFVPDILTKIREIPGRRAEFLKSLPAKFSQKGKFLLIGLGAALLVLIICLVTAVILMNRTSGGPINGADALMSRGFQPGELQPRDLQPQIPPGELFLSDEPDFIPEVILGRERRDSWTAEDAAAFWYNPLEQGEEPWRGRVESVIDELLEHVP
jgi:hypothetical protein